MLSLAVVVLVAGFDALLDAVQERYRATSRCVASPVTLESEMGPARAAEPGC